MIGVSFGRVSVSKKVYMGGHHVQEFKKIKSKLPRTIFQCYLHHTHLKIVHLIIKYICTMTYLSVDTVT